MTSSTSWHYQPKSNDIINQHQLTSSTTINWHQLTSPTNIINQHQLTSSTTINWHHQPPSTDIINHHQLTSTDITKHSSTAWDVEPCMLCYDIALVRLHYTENHYTLNWYHQLTLSTNIINRHQLTLSTNIIRQIVIDHSWKHFTHLVLNQCELLLLVWQPQHGQ